MNKTNSIPNLPAVGANVHRERRRQQLSLEALAATSGVSKAMLSQIESDKVNPTIATMWKIAHALNVDFNVLVNGGAENVRKFECFRAAQLPQMRNEESGIEFRVLSPVSMAEKFEMYLATMRPGARHLSQPHAARTEEYLTVLEGQIRVRAGENCVELGVGDFLLYQADVEHEIANIGDGAAKLHMTVYYP